LTAVEAKMFDADPDSRICAERKREIEDIGQRI
jgi:hypothetical protein